MRYFLLLFLFVTTPAWAQEVLQSCEFKTNGTGASQGMKIKFVMPCKWEGTTAKAPVVRTFSSVIDSTLVLESIVIKKNKTRYTAATINKLLSIEELKKTTEENEQFVFGRRMKVDGVDCGEVATRMVKKSDVMNMHIYSVRYLFPVKDKLLIIGFAVSSANEAGARDIFNAYKFLFYQLASSTDFLN